MKSLCRISLVCFIALMVTLFYAMPNVFLLAAWYFPMTMLGTFAVVAFLRFIFSGSVKAH